MYSIKFWGGRFGNNIQQISNAIFYCEKNKLNFVSPPNDLINSFSVNFGNNFCEPKIFFFHVDSQLNNGFSDFKVDVEQLKIKRREICRNFIYKNLKINFNNVTKLDEDVVVAHIRSGDIFSRKNYYCNVVSNYIQNPLSYYKEIFNDYKKIIVLTEDYENPVIQELSKEKNIEIIITDVEKTIEMMLSARNIVTSGVSSFAIACSLLSENIERLYCSDIRLDEILNYTDFLDPSVDLIIKNIDMKNYINYNTWLNNEDQRKLMIEYQK